MKTVESGDFILFATQNGSPEEMLSVRKDGFYVRGVKIPQDEKEAKIVYDAFIEWLSSHQLSQVNNPCHHTGFESASCDICGYPDPRKVIAKLKLHSHNIRAICTETI